MYTIHAQTPPRYYSGNFLTDGSDPENITWDLIKYAKLFQTEYDAKDFLRKIRGSETFVKEREVSIMFIHPLNMR